MSNRFTEERLSELHILRREITRTKRRLAELRARAAEGKEIPEFDLALAKTRENLQRYLLQMQTEEAELLDYIQSIEDPTTREIFMLRYYDGVRTWQKVAFLIGEYDESFVRKRAKAELKKAGH